VDGPEAYLNGRFLPAAAANVSPVDAGFVLGAAVAEQVRTFRGEPFRLESHVDRLLRSLAIVGIDAGMGRDEFVEVGRELVARNRRLLDPADDLGLAIFVTPGPYVQYGGAGEATPTVCLHTYPLPFQRWADKYARGESLVVTEFQQVPPQCWPAELKCRSRMHYYLADRRAAEREPGARAVLLDQRGLVTETSTANVLMFRSGEGLVSVPHHTILHGISMAVVKELARGLGVATSERALTPGDLARAEEVLLTSTPFGVLPATRLGGRPIADGRPGPVFRRLLGAWSDLVGVDIAAQARQFADRTAASVWP
jgi:branched-subunit amino acid aminotransferase/4-amino-4-deoxychorismate lyase